MDEALPVCFEKKKKQSYEQRPTALSILSTNTEAS